MTLIIIMMILTINNIFNLVVTLISTVLELSLTIDDNYNVFVFYYSFKKMINLVFRKMLDSRVLWTTNSRAPKANSSC